MGLGTTVPTWYSAKVQKTAENCGGRSGARSPDLLGVNDGDTDQTRHLTQTVRGRFANNDPFGSVSVPGQGTNRTIDADDLKVMVALDFSCTPPDPEARGRWTGYVYFVGGDCECVKIGWTREDPRKRLRALQTGSPVRLYLLAWTKAEPFHEKEYHQRFKASWSHGEWFKKSPALLSLIDGLNRTNNHERWKRGLPNE
jgi:hypothetical protein